MLPGSSLSGNIRKYRVSSCRIRIIPNSHVNIVLINNCLQRKSSINQLLDTDDSRHWSSDVSGHAKQSMHWCASEWGVRTGARNTNLHTLQLACMLAWLQSHYIDLNNTQRLPGVDLVCGAPLHPVFSRHVTCCSNFTCVHAGVVVPIWCIVYGAGKLVCVFVGQLARKGVNVEYISDLASRLHPTMAESWTKHVDILAGLLFQIFYTEHFRLSIVE